MNKTEAAQYLECSPRAIERYVSSGKLAARYERGKTGNVLALDVEELERFKAELNAPTFPNIAAHIAADNARQSPTEAPTMSRAIVPSPNLQTRVESDYSAIMRLLEVAATTQANAQATTADKSRNAPTVPTENKLLLTLPECSALTGLSRGVLRAAIDGGSLKAAQIGRGWKVKRRDLESYIEEL